ncbi:MAG: hypothetical protein KIS79_11595 [Burkholderiales bacterium]|nr:hypothetical protein [Burkholderiales bacterium]
MFGLSKSSKKGERPADPVSAANALIQALPRNEPLVSLCALSGHLDRLRAADEVTPQQALDVVDLLDRGGRPHYRGVMRDYLARQRKLTKFQEEQIWRGVSTYLEQIGQGYRHCLHKFETGARGALELTPKLALIAARAMRAQAMRMKWHYLRYSPLEPRQWSDVGALYALAEAGGIARLRTTPYRNAQQDSSVEEEFLRALLLAVASPQSLLPQQIEIADRLIALCASQLVLATHTAESLRHLVDLQSDAGPQRIEMHTKLTRSSRAFGACQALEHLKGIEAEIQEQALQVATRRLIEEFDEESVLATVRHLIRHWGPTLPLRRHERRRHAQRISVVHDFDEIAAHVSGLTLDYPFVSEQEQWLVENESRSGMHALVTSPNGRWLEVGALLALRKADENTWSTGIVRRLARDEGDDGNGRTVGIEIIAQGGAGVTLLPLSAGNQFLPAEGVLCALLSGRDQPTDEVTLLLRKGTFSPSLACEMRAYDQRYRLVPLRLTAQGAGYEIARYKVLRLGKL